jgi:LmbE family N-acetylglucosaminyl deacetylase
VLHVAAHPDDENTHLITYLARGRGYRTAYLSVTRGDGGQNDIGPEFGEKLGVARTQELLVARKLDGGRQFFTRALDFGYSKSLDETLSIWDRRQVIGDIVRVIRTFRPDVIATRFAPVAQRGNHGHHNASAVLALEAFKLAGDAKEFPEQLAEGLTPWQPKRILLNGGFRDAGADAQVRIDVAGIDPVLGESFASIATRSRAMHKTQFGFGSGAGTGGGGGASGGPPPVPPPRLESFQLLAGDPAKDDIMDGIDTTWARVPGGAEVAPLVADAIAQFNPENPSASVAALLTIHRHVAALPADPVVEDRRRQLDRIIAACLGLKVDTTASQIEIVPGEPLTIQHTATVQSDIPVKLREVRVPNLSSAKPNKELKRGQAERGDLTFTTPKNTPITQPYWLREEGTPGMSRVAETKLIGQAENAPPFPVEYVFEVGGETLVLSDEPLAPETGKPARRLAIISPVSLQFGSDVALFAPGSKKTVEVEVTAARAGVTGTLQLESPAGWNASPKSHPFKLKSAGEKVRLTFTVTAPATTASGDFRAVADVGGARFNNQRFELRYDHIPVQLLQAPARLRVTAFNYAIRGKNVGYLPGAGDDTAENLTQLGYSVTTLADADLTVEKLRGLDAVVIGVRAFNQRNLGANLPGLFAYVEQGGTVVALYTRPNGIKTPQLGPYKLSLAGAAPQLRVTDEFSPVTFLAPEHPALTTPNRLGPADFEGWVQERGAYFPSSWDEEHYTPLLAMNDPGDPPLKSSLLVARHGKGYYVYTGLGFFRQLPAGVPGAYRLFANLVSLGKE